MHVLSEASSRLHSFCSSRNSLRCCEERNSRWRQVSYPVYLLEASRQKHTRARTPGYANDITGEQLNILLLDRLEKSVNALELTLSWQVQIKPYEINVDRKETGKWPSPRVWHITKTHLEGERFPSNTGLRERIPGMWRNVNRATSKLHKTKRKGY